MDERLHRSSDDRMVAGVCAGIADYVGMDPSLVRVLYAFVAIVTGIVPLLVVYVVLAIVLPDDPTWSVSHPAAAASAPPEAPRPGRAARGADAGLVIGACLVLAGLALLVEPYLHIAWDVVWPVAVIGIGALLVIRGFRRRS